MAKKYFDLKCRNGATVRFAPKSEGVEVTGYDSFGCLSDRPKLMSRDKAVAYWRQILAAGGRKVGYSAKWSRDNLHGGFDA